MKIFNEKYIGSVIVMNTSLLFPILYLMKYILDNYYNGKMLSPMMMFVIYIPTILYIAIIYIKKFIKKF